MNNSKRICLTIDLKNNPDLIFEYRRIHERENNWPEINKGIMDSGITVMDIYNIDNRLFMICEIPENLNLDECWEKMANAPRQSEWAKLVAKYMQAVPNHEKEWLKMDLIYQLPTAD